MARPCEFDRGELLTKAGAQFWRKGYQATSIQSVASATGVKPGSLPHLEGSDDDDHCGERGVISIGLTPEDAS